MLWPQALALALALVPSLASAAIFPKNSKVKMLDATSFHKVMKKNESSMVAFVAPWCGHCKNLAPEYSKAAEGLSPMVPLYAVDCDEEINKPLCGAQDVKGFPTIKFFPRGGRKPSVPYNDERKAGPIFNYASKAVPDVVKRLSKADDITAWAEKKTDRPRALLLGKDKKVPLLWKALGNRYTHKMEFATAPDPKGTILAALGLTVDDEKKGAKVVIYAPDSDEPVLYSGLSKYVPLAQFFRSVMDGTAELAPAKKEEASPVSESEEKEPESTVITSPDAEPPAEPERPKDEL